MKRTYILNKQTNDKYPAELCTFYGKTLETAEVYYNSEDEWSVESFMEAGQWDYIEEEIELTFKGSFDLYTKYKERKSELVYEALEEATTILREEPVFDYSKANYPIYSLEDPDAWDEWIEVRNSFKDENPDFEGIKKYNINPEEFLLFTKNLLNYRKDFNELREKILMEKQKKLEKEIENMLN